MYDEVKRHFLVCIGVDVETFESRGLKCVLSNWYLTSSTVSNALVLLWQHNKCSWTRMKAFHGPSTIWVDYDHILSES